MKTFFVAFAFIATFSDKFLPSFSQIANTSTDGYCGNGRVGNKTCAVQSACCSKFGYCSVSDQHCSASVCVGGPCHARLQRHRPMAEILSLDMFNVAFPPAARHGHSCNGTSTLSYENLLSAAGAFPFFAIGDRINQLQELAAFFAQVRHETGALCWVSELRTKGHAEKLPRYCDMTRIEFACKEDAAPLFYGRGALMLSWNYNYGEASRDLSEDIFTNPGLVATKGVLAWKTALWFWMNRGCHDSLWTKGFGSSTDIITGSLECQASRPALENFSEAPAARRARFYLAISSQFGVPIVSGPLIC